MKLTILLASLAFINSGSLQASILITLSPQTSTVSLGSTTQIQLGISGLGLHAAPSLGAFDLNLAFDPTILSFTGLTFGDPIKGDQLNLSGAGSLFDFSNTPAGQLEFYEISFDSPTLLDTTQANQFILATLQFTTIKAGTSLLLPSLNSLSDSQGASLNAGVQTGRVTISSTPEPATFGMLALAVACLLIAKLLNKKPASETPTPEHPQS